MKLGFLIDDASEILGWGLGLEMGQCVVSAGLELTVENRLALDAQKATWLCLLSTWC